MKKILSVIVIFVVIGLSNNTFAQTILDFKVVNKTGIPFYSLYVGASSSEDWGKDLLPEDILDNDEEMEIKFTRGEITDCKWDIWMDKDANAKTHVTVMSVDLCEVSEIIFTMNDKGRIMYTKK